MTKEERKIALELMQDFEDAADRFAKKGGNIILYAACMQFLAEEHHAMLDPEERVELYQYLHDINQDND